LRGAALGDYGQKDMNQSQASKIITVEITSFSYKKPIPEKLFSDEEGRHGGGFVFDCRCLPNPGREERYKNLTGRDFEVAEYLKPIPQVSVFREHVFALVTAAVESYLARDFEFLSVGFGCTGGQHRSVFFTEELSRHLHERFSERIVTRTWHSNLVG
jgi:RNase adaptor protein for sRNA GlmZ degradation